MLVLIDWVCDVDDERHCCRAQEKRAEVLGVFVSRSDQRVLWKNWEFIYEGRMWTESVVSGRNENMRLLQTRSLGLGLVS